MIYDPSRSVSFHQFLIANPNATETPTSKLWEDVLATAAPLMDDDIREEVHALISPTDNHLEWMLKYMELHYKHYNSHFEWT